MLPESCFFNETRLVYFIFLAIFCINICAVTMQVYKSTIKVACLTSVLFSMYLQIK